MLNKKEFTLPFWCLIPLIMVQAFALYFNVSMVSWNLERERKYEQQHAAELDKYPFPQLSHHYIPEAARSGITIIILMAEGMLLWRVRKKRYNRWLAVGYLLPLAFVLAAIPILAIRNNIRFDWLVPNPLLYWIGLAIAHIFLWLIIRQAKRRKNVQPADPANLLDEFAETDFK